MWASHEEYMEQFRNETYSPQEYEAYMEYLYEQQRYEIEAENAWLRAAEAPTLEDLAFEDYERQMGLL